MRRHTPAWRNVSTGSIGGCLQTDPSPGGDRTETSWSCWGLRGQVLPSVTQIRIQHNSPESGLIRQEAVANGSYALGSGTRDANVALNRCEGMKPSLLPPHLCALARGADSTARCLQVRTGSLERESFPLTRRI